MRLSVCFDRSHQLVPREKGFGGACSAPIGSGLSWVVCQYFQTWIDRHPQPDLLKIRCVCFYMMFLQNLTSIEDLLYFHFYSWDLAHIFSSLHRDILDSWSLQDHLLEGSFEGCSQHWVPGGKPKNSHLAKLVSCDTKTRREKTCQGFFSPFARKIFVFRVK